jgi:hypothetical protein
MLINAQPAKLDSHQLEIRFNLHQWSRRQMLSAGLPSLEAP